MKISILVDNLIRAIGVSNLCLISTINMKGLKIMRKVQTKLILAVFFTAFLFMNSSLAVAQSGNMISWHSSVTTNAIFGWKVTFAQSENQSMSFPLGDKQLGLGDVVQFKFVGSPPTDGDEFFDIQAPPTWMYMYVNGEQVDYYQMGDEGSAFIRLILPVSASLANGTNFNLTEVNRFGPPQEMEDMASYYQFNSTHFNATYIDEYARLNYITNLETGITGFFSADVYDVGVSIVLEYFTAAANVNEDGVTETINSEYNTFANLSTGTEIYFIIGGVGVCLIVAIIIILRRR
jgi:hypothetical protein